MPELCVNIDHVATVRQARRTYEPDPIEAAREAEAGGADGITVHLREDRRHIQDADLPRLKAAVRTKLNLEMAATDEMVGIAIGLRPDLAMFVPERRQEVTTEGGLDVAGQEARIREAVARLKGSGIPVSAFIDADERQLGRDSTSARSTPGPTRMPTTIVVQRMRQRRRNLRRLHARWPPCAPLACRRTPGMHSTGRTSRRSRRSRGCANCTSVTRSCRTRSSSGCARRLPQCAGRSPKVSLRQRRAEFGVRRVGREAHLARGFAAGDVRAGTLRA